MAITPLPTPPSRSQSPATFSTDADAFLGALPAFASEANALAADVNADEASAAASATTASNAASVAVGAANYQGDYNAGTTYQIGESVSYSGRRYVAKTINTGVTPADGANWFLINDGDVLGPVSATNNALALYDGTTGKIIKSGLNNGTAGQALISGGAGNPPVWGNVESGVQQFTASGSITAGQPVCLRSDGAVEVATGFSQAETLGPNNSFSAEQTTRRNAYPIVGTSDIVIFTKTSTPTPTAIHATVSGTTVTVNTLNTVPWAATYPNNEIIACCHDPVSGKYLVAWGQPGSIQAAVMTVTGTIITFGAPMTLVGSLAQGQWANIIYDALRQQLIVGYNATATSGNRIVGIIAVTISGTTPVAGHSRVLLDQLIDVVASEVVYDSTVNRILYYHSDTSNNYTLVRIVANTGTAFLNPSGFVTVSNFYAGTKNMNYDPTSGRWVLVGATATTSGNAAVVSLSVAAETITASSVVTAVVESTTINNARLTRVAYDSLTSRHIVTVYTQLNQVFYAVVNATSGTPSFGAFTSIIPGFGTRTPEVVYVTSQLRSVLLYYVDSGATGRAQTYQPAASGTNTQNFIGLAAASASTGQTVNVTVTGGRNSNQTGLTTGASYFLTSLGALTTAGGVRVGEALSATSIFVEGRLNSSGTPSAATFLRGDGAFAAISDNMVIFSSSGTWTIPAGVTRALVYVTGGGGGATSNPRSGGAAGATAISILDLTGATATITIGAAGSGGGAGGTSTFVNGVTTLTATGGAGGSSNYGGTLGGTASGGQLNLAGGDGGPDYSSGDGGTGGSSFWGGGGGGGRSGGYPGNAGRVPGSGGGGSSSGGGAGASGIVVIEY